MRSREMGATSWDFLSAGVRRRSEGFNLQALGVGLMIYEDREILDLRVLGSRQGRANKCVTILFQCRVCDMVPRVYCYEYVVIMDREKILTC